MRNSLGVAIFTIALACCLQAASSAPSSKIAERETDTATGLRDKLQRLHELLTELEPKEDDEKAEDDLEKVVETQPKKPVAETEEVNVQTARDVSSRDMGRKLPRTEKTESEESRDDDSIQLLARALARLREPKYTQEGFERDQSRRKSDQSASSHADKVNQLQRSIQRALIRLDRDKFQLRQEEEQQASVAERRNEILKEKFHTEALSLIEERLIRDVILASKLGVSVDNLIDDLDEKAFQVATARKVEEGFRSDGYGHYLRGD